MIPTSQTVTLQSAAAATGNGTAASVADYALLACQVTGTFVATITFEGSVDGTNYVAIEAINIATGAKATTATAAGVYRMGVAGLTLARARVTWTSGTSVTVVGFLTTAMDAIIQEAEVTAATLTAGELHIGEVGGNTLVVSVTPTVTAGAYTAGDVVGAIQTIANATRVSGEPTILQSVVLTDLAMISQAFTIFFFNANPANGTYTDNIALDIHDTDLAMCVGFVKITASDYANATDNGVACVRNLALPLTPAATSLFAIAQATGTAPTYVATSDLTFRYGFLRD